MTRDSARPVALLLALGASLGFAACDAEEPPPAPVEGSAPETPEAPPAAPASNPAAAVPEVTSPTPAASPAPAGKVRVVRILVPWKGAAGAGSGVTRGKGEARARAEEALAKLRSGTAASEVVKSFSEDALASKGGAMGDLSPGDLQAPYSRVFEVPPGQATEVMESPMGYVVLVRGD